MSQIAQQHASVAPGITDWAKGVRQALLREVARSRVGYRIFRGLGRYYHVQEIRVAGEYGMIEGPLYDSAILQAYALNRSWAQSANQFFGALFERAGGGTYIDGGANLGLTTIPVAQNPRVACRAFEPAPRVFSCLSRNIQANCRHGNVELFNLALFDRRTMLEFELSSSNSGDNRIRMEPDRPGPGAGASRPTVNVPADRLDDILDVTQLARPIVAKIITQGAEARVFAGGARVLGEAEALVFEFDPGMIRRIEGDSDILTRILGANFRTAALQRGALFETGEAGAPPLVWKPAAEVVGEMSEAMRNPAPPGLDYYYIYACR